MRNRPTRLVAAIAVLGLLAACSDDGDDTAFGGDGGPDVTHSVAL